jgi:hypothetical protein
MSARDYVSLVIKQVIDPSNEKKPIRVHNHSRKIGGEKFHCYLHTWSWEVVSILVLIDPCNIDNLMSQKNVSTLRLSLQTMETCKIMMPDKQMEYSANICLQNMIVPF